MINWIKAFKRLGVLILFLMSFTTSADEYWVIGSFGKASNAVAESDRLSNRLGQNVQVLAAGELHRLVVIKSAEPDQQKTRLVGEGLSPWTLVVETPAKTVQTMSIESTVVAQPSAPEMRANDSKPESPEARTAKASAVNIMPPKAGENQVTWCLKEANGEQRARYCSNDVVARISQAQKLVETSEKARVLLFCSLNANGLQRRQYCQK